MLVMLFRTVIGCDRSAYASKQVDLPQIPAIGTEIRITTQPVYREWQVEARVQDVRYRIDDSIPIIADIYLQSDSAEFDSEDPEGGFPLESMLEDYSGWDITLGNVENNSAHSIEQQYFGNWPLRDDSGILQDEVLLESLIWTKNPDGSIMTASQVKGIISALSPEVRDRIVKSHLQKLRVEGRLHSILGSDDRLTCKVFLWTAGAEQPTYENLHRFSRVPNRGEHIQILGESYKVASVRHVDPLLGIDAVLYIVPL